MNTDDYVTQRGIFLEILQDRGENSMTDEGEGWEHHSWLVRLHHDGRTIDTPYLMGIKLEGEPQAAEVLDSLLSGTWDAYNHGADFEGWAGEFGYDTDSRRAYAEWKEARRYAVDLAEFLGGTDEFELLATEYERL